MNTQYIEPPKPCKIAMNIIIKYTIVMHVVHRKINNFSIPNFPLTPSDPKVVIILEFYCTVFPV